MNESKVQKGVSDAMSYWLNDHPVSMADILTEAIEKAVSKWLDANEDELLTKVAAEIARQSYLIKREDSE